MSGALRQVYDETTPRDWYVRHLPGTNDDTYEVRVYIDSWEVRIQISDSGGAAGEGQLDVSATGARELAVHLIEAADLVGHIPSRDRVADTCRLQDLLKSAPPLRGSEQEAPCCPPTG